MKNITSKISDFLYNRKTVLLIALVVVMACLPFLGLSSYFNRILAMIGSYAILGLSLNLITGYMGVMSLGHAALYCLGAYAGALCSTLLGTNFWVSMLVAIFVGALAGAFQGFVTMKLNGAYMTVTTLAFAEVITMIAKNWVSLTNGPVGIKGISRPSLFGWEMTTSNGGLYWLILVLLILVTLFVWAIINSKMGRAIRAIKEDALASNLMGIDLRFYRVFVVAISGGIAGVAGCFYAHMSGYIDPSVFSFDISMTILTIVIFGGLASIPGSIVGAIFMISFPEALQFLAEYRYLIYGFLLIIMLRFRPQGLLGGNSSRPYNIPKGVVLPSDKTPEEGVS